MALIGGTNEQKIWNFLKNKGLGDHSVAGVMGNLYAESALNPCNLQNTYEKKLGMTDAQYTIAVDNGKYTNFIKDSAGYGLAQWTYWSRKESLFNFCKNMKTSIGDLEMQLEFLWKELQGYKNLMSILSKAKTVKEASDAVLLDYERPADQSDAVKVRRANYGQGYFNKYAKSIEEVNKMSNSSLVNYTKISPNKTSPRNHAIDTITIHCVVGQASVESLGNVFAPTSRQASSNYGVGPDGRIGMYCEEKDRSWCSSSAANDNRAITIEVASDTTHPYAVTAAALNATIKLVADICKRNGIKKLLWKGDKNLIGQVDKQNMTVHRWFANKSCPGEYLYERHGYIADEVNKILGSGTSPAPQPKPEPVPTTNIKAGDVVKLANNAVYFGGKDIPSWVKNQNWIVASISGNRAVINKNTAGTSAINSPVDVKFLSLVNAPAPQPKPVFSPYLVKVTADVLNIRKGAGTGFAITGVIKDKGIYTIVEESSGTGATKWGRLKSGAGWISLDFCQRK